MRLLPESILIIKPVAESTLVIWVSMIGRWGHWFSRHDNVSYDMYLFHFPIIQLAVLLGAPALGKWPTFLICLAAVILLSFLSWNLIGKPFMKVKKKWLENKKL
jgi:peptidoglycan/LPS O-acetylase OafA/YrhL